VTIRVRTAAVAIAVFCFTVLGMAATTITPAHAESGDSIDAYKVGYVVTSTGVVHVKETITYRFASSGRHGIYRNLVVREPYVDDESKDQLYQVSNIDVSSTTPGVSSEFTKKTLDADRGRSENIQLQIGSATSTLNVRTATYVISYDVRGALRHFTDHSEFYWDVTGSGWDLDAINNTSVTVQVPKGVTQATCFAGTNSKASCTSSTIGSDGVATYTQTSLSSGEQLTIDAGITAGAVTNDTPVLADPPSLLARNGVGAPAAVTSGVLTVFAAVGAFLYHRRGNKDKRFAGMPPGTFPPPGVTAALVDNDIADDQIPVAFSPPVIPVAEAGLLIDATIDTRETAATLIDLAVRGGVRVVEEEGVQYAELVDPRVATIPHEQALMTGLFPGLAPGTRVTLARGNVGDNTMFNAHNATVAAVRSQVAQQDWYQRMPSPGRGRPGAGTSRNLLGCAVVLVFFSFSGFVSAITAVIGGGSLKAVLVILPLVAIIGGLVAISKTRGRGQRSAVGRAVDDQALGFRKYLATAEADQLRFEEGDDIFSRYLPWAIAFDLADRWQKVCQQLVAQGRIPAQPSWYYGPNYYANPFLFSAFASNMQNSFSPPPSPPSSGGGGGSSSGFGGGGFSGGGGGGGGGGSW
jgi:uncharacterized membrane protein YgcG